MNVLKKHLRDYLELRRALGFELGRVESRLRGFLAFMKIKRAGQITTKLAIEFALNCDRSASTQAGYLSAIRGFAQYLSGIEPNTEVPPTGLIRRGHRPQPYIYSDDEIIRILDAAWQHPATPRYALKPHTLYCLFGLLSVTGMRLTEALNLRFEDIDWAHGVLTIGRAKFQKSRLVPLHKSAIQELRTYIERRNQFFAERPWRYPVNRIFVSTHGGALTSNDVGANFRMLTRQIGIREAGASQGPRIHDLRHRFAVSTLLRWYRRGKNVDLLLPVLSTYLGHVFITGTYWYLTCTPELMEAAAKRLDRRWKGSNHA
jgi:integrase/recombinase XerD